jgi:hypothetical protein
MTSQRRLLVGIAVVDPVDYEGAAERLAAYCVPISSAADVLALRNMGGFVLHIRRSVETVLVAPLDAGDSLITHTGDMALFYAKLSSVVPACIATMEVGDVQKEVA